MSNEWIIDPQTGRRYRWITDGCREWETDYIFSSGKSESTEAPSTESSMEIIKSCPILRRDCIKERCSMFDSGGGCVLRTGVDAYPIGRICPYKNRTCETRCMMYDNGCKLRR